MGKSEQCDTQAKISVLKVFLSVLIRFLLRWQYQPERQGSSSWLRIIKGHRKALAFLLKNTPSLKAKIADADWLDSVWSDAVTIALKEKNLENLPETCPWAVEDILNQDWHP